jgi:hypothetical protein
MQTSDFPIILVKYAQVISTSQFSTVYGLPYLVAILHFDFHDIELHQLGFHNRSGYFKHDVSAEISCGRSTLGFLGVIALRRGSDVEAEKSCLIRCFGHQRFFIRKLKMKLLPDEFPNFLLYGFCIVL